MGRRAAVLAAVAFMVMTAVPSGATTGIHGRSVRTHAQIDVVLVHHVVTDEQRVQILTSVCDRPSRLRGCTSMPTRLRAALDRALGPRVEWVDARLVPGPEFLVLAPVRMGRDRAVARIAWWERGRFGCFGGARIRFERLRGSWREVRGEAWAGCPVG